MPNTAKKSLDAIAPSEQLCGVRDYAEFTIGTHRQQG